MYTIRIRGNSWRPRVFKAGRRYTIRVGEGKRAQVFKGIVAGKESDSRTITVEFASPHISSTS